MNILVIGNGFDLAHGLPTKYTHFLEFFIKLIPICNKYINFDFNRYKTIYLDDYLLNKQVEKVSEYTYKIKNDICEIKIKDSMLKEIFECVNHNFWIYYFMQLSKNGNWIDFERDIFQVIQSIDKDMEGKNFYGQIDFLSNKYLENTFLYKTIDSLFTDENGERMGKEQITYQELRDKLHKDLDRLIRALEIYLTQYVENQNIKVISPDIKEKEVVIQINRNKHTTLFAKVISFNYTNTFQKLYGKSKEIEYDYIHGKADIHNTIETNNMVLGIDEYLPDDRRNKDIEFIAFKKFYQRIYKETGCKYKEWVDKIRLNKEQSHNLYIFGHSLDVTDKDVLRDLILNDNVYTTIFYLNKSVMGQQIANLVKVIGQDELIKRTGGSTKTIEFKQQRDMVEIH